MSLTETSDKENEYENASIENAASSGHQNLGAKPLIAVLDAASSISRDSLISRVEQLQTELAQEKYDKKKILLQKVKGDKELAKARHENKKIFLQKKTQEEKVRKIFNQDQLAKLGLQSTRGSHWSDDTIKKSTSNTLYLWS